MSVEDVVKRKERYAELMKLAVQHDMTSTELKAWIKFESGKKETKDLTLEDIVRLRDKLAKAVMGVDKEIKSVGKDIEAAAGEAIVVAPVLPLPTEGEITELFMRFQAIKRAVITDVDKLFIGKDGKPCRKEEASAEHIRKSGWRKLGLVCSVSIELTQKGSVDGDDEHGHWHGYSYRVKASLPSGRFVEAEGVATSRNAFFCKRWDDETKTYRYIDTDDANLIRMAQTVAINRAISDLLGSGELSAEEVE